SGFFSTARAGSRVHRYGRDSARAAQLRIPLEIDRPKHAHRAETDARCELSLARTKSLPLLRPTGGLPRTERVRRRTLSELRMGSVVVLGGYGNFGRRIVAALASDANAAGHRVLIAGRSRERAERFAREVGGNAEPFAVDCHAPSFAEALARADAKIVIHTAGPFQTQDYAVPHAWIEARAHYVDLADARAFVCGIRALDDAAKRSETLVVSGASSLPALSSAVVDRLARDFSSIHSIEHVITSGAIPPGLATMSGVLSYAGKPFERWH